MKKLLENFRKFEEGLLNEGRATLKFNNLDLKSRHDTNIKPFKTKRQALILVRSVVNQYKKITEKLYEKSLENRRMKKALPTSNLRILSMRGYELDSERVQTAIYKAMSNFLEHYKEFTLNSIGDEGGFEGVAFVNSLGEIAREFGFDPIGAYVIKNNIENNNYTDSTIKHEAHHILFNEIKSKYGKAVYNFILNVLIGIIRSEAPDALNTITTTLISRFGYRRSSPFFKEEIVNFVHTILTSKEKREKFFRLAGTEHETDEDPFLSGKSQRDMMNNLKSAWKKMVQWAKQLKPEDLPQ